MARFLPAGPWSSKSGGSLEVIYSSALALPAMMAEFFDYSLEELALVQTDIRGFRLYTVTGIPKGGVGGREFHRLRHELFFTLSGALQVCCEDMMGGRLEWVMPARHGVHIKPTILHTVTALEPDTDFLVVANTLFDPEDPRTHDCYSEVEFKRLKGEFIAAL